MTARLFMPHLVTPAKAWGYHLSDRFAWKVQGMVSCLRGNDEVEIIGEVQ